jgi:hypothetical protein
MSQRVKTSARGPVLPRSSSPENGHLRKNYVSSTTTLYKRINNMNNYGCHDTTKQIVKSDKRQTFHQPINTQLKIIYHFIIF